MLDNLGNIIVFKEIILTTNAENGKKTTFRIIFESIKGRDKEKAGKEEIGVAKAD